MTAGLDAMAWDGPQKKTRAKKAPKNDGPVNLQDMYRRPEPNVFSEDWNDAYNAGYDGEPFKVVGTTWMDGYRTGQIARSEHDAEMNRIGSSNT